MRTADDEVAELYRVACPRLIGLLTAVAGSRADAEEVAQEAFVRLLQRWPRIRTYDDPEAWLRTVAVRTMVDRHRRRSVASLGLRRLQHETEQAAGPPDATGVDVDRALAQLSVAQRAVVLLHHLHDLPVDEVASALRLPVGTVKSRLSRARAALAPLLADDHRSIL